MGFQIQSLELLNIQVQNSRVQYPNVGSCLEVKFVAVFRPTDEILSVPQGQSLSKG